MTKSTEQKSGAVWTHRRGECLGGDGDYSLIYDWQVLRDGVVVLHFEGLTFDKHREQQPISIAVDEANEQHVEVTYDAAGGDRFRCVTEDGGRTWSRSPLPSPWA